MPSERTTYRKRIAGKLKDKKIVWVGSRSCDAIPLTEFKNNIVSICYGSPALHEAIKEHTYEEMMEHRVNPYTYDQTQDTSEGGRELRRLLIKELEEPSFVIPYRPMEMVDTAFFLHHEKTKMLGLFSEFQHPFNHKTWLETTLQNDGMRTIPWQYRQFNEAAKQEIYREVVEHPVMLRVNASAAGPGIVRIDSRHDFEAAWNWMTNHNAKLIAFSRYFSGASPICASATVYEDGRVALHPLSLQCIGVPELTPINSGYSGNDFGVTKDFPPHAFNQLEAMIRHTGQWLSSKGYLGSFGLDALFHNDEMYYIETNPRFMVSSKLTASIDAALDRPDVYMTHIASFLGLPPPPQIPLVELNALQPQMGQMIFHNTHPHLVKVQKRESHYNDLPFSVIQTPEPTVSVDPGSPISTLYWNEPLLLPNGHLNETGQFIAATFLQSITLRPQGLHLGVEDEAP
ncbi:MAG: hypothetical protein MI749_03730 [Desulfovibrionales bacterium]|nr:hypothetical protein [Desulfovibrionales bacterium]